MKELENRKIFSNNLKMYIEHSGKSRREVAKGIGISATTFNDWVNGHTCPKIEKIEMIAKYFNITKSNLIERNDDEFSIAVGKLLATKDENLIKLIIGISKMTPTERTMFSKTIETFINILQN